MRALISFSTTFFLILLRLQLFANTTLSDSIKSDSIINVHDFKIFGDSTTDYTDQIQKVLDNHQTVYFPAGTYLISKSLTLSNKQKIIGEKNASIFTVPDSTGSSAKFAFMRVDGKRNISVSNINFVLKNTPKKAVTAVKGINVAYLKLTGLNTINCGIVETWKKRSISYNKVPVLQGDEIDQVSNFFIEIDSCNGIGAIKGMGAPSTGILLRYANHWKVTNSQLKGFHHGVQWWGGDSNPARDGDTIKVRKSINGLVYNTEIDSIRGGGIWGSMGDNIRVEACKVSHCTDVGIDFEGCNNSVAINNEVKNCKNGGLAIFHYNKNILFDNNIVSTDYPKQVLARIYNSSQKQDNGKVVFRENTFTANKGIGIIDQRGPAKYIEFKRNTLNNAVLNLNFNNNHYILVENNDFNVSRPIAPYKYIVKAGQTHRKGVIEIKNNLIKSKVEQADNIFAISIYQSDYNSSPRNYLVNNHIQGLHHHMRVEWAGKNKGMTTQTYIESDQEIPQSAIQKVNSGKRASELYINGKKKAN